MTHPAIINMLRRYDLSTAHSSYDALREILQEIVLVALYDLVWYVGNGTELDLTHLQARLAQSCKYLESNGISLPEQITRDAVIKLLEQRITSLDIAKARADVLPFIRDSRELDLWSTEFFMQVVQQL